MTFFNCAKRSVTIATHKHVFRCQTQMFSLLLELWLSAAFAAEHIWHRHHRICIVNSPRILMHARHESAVHVSLLSLIHHHKYIQIQFIPFWQQCLEIIFEIWEWAGKAVIGCLGTGHAGGTLKRKSLFNI